MNITRILLTISLLINSVGTFSQKTNGYYFKDFTNGQVILKNKQFARGKFNYDFVNRQMHFLNGGVDMIVENLQDIDTIIIDKIRFIPFDGRFVEVVKGNNALMLVEMNVNTREQGKVGAMGVATHGTVQAIDVNARFQRVNGVNNTDIKIYKDEIKYTYFVRVKEHWKPFRNQVTFLKLFPKKNYDAIKKVINEKKTDFDNPDDVLRLCDEINF